MRRYMLWITVLFIAAVWANSVRAGESVGSSGASPSTREQPSTGEQPAGTAEATEATIPGDRQTARPIFVQARTAYNERRYQEAIGLFRQAHEAWPHPAFLYNIGQCYRHLDNGEQAVQFYQQYVEGCRNAGSAAELQPIVHINMAECYHMMGRTDEARQALQRYLNDAPGGQDRATAQAAIESGRSPAEQERRDPQAVAQARAIHDEAQALFERGRYREAAERFLEGYRRFNNITELLESAAIAYERAEMWAEAAQAYRQYLETAGARRDAYVSLACVLHRQGQYQDAIAAYRRYLELEPGGEFAEDARQYIQSMTAAGGGEGGTPSPQTLQRAREHFRRGDQHYNAGRYPEALDEYGRAYDLIPHADTLFNMAMCRFRQRAWDRALTDFENILRAGDTGANAMVHLRAAECLLELSRPLAAEEHVRDYLRRADEAELPEEARFRQLATQLLARIGPTGGSNRAPGLDAKHRLAAAGSVRFIPCGTQGTL